MAKEEIKTSHRDLCKSHPGIMSTRLSALLFI